VDLARVISPGAGSRGPRVSHRPPVSSIVSVAAHLPLLTCRSRDRRSPRDQPDARHQPLRFRRL
jgi:hypothetical protein